MDDADDSSMSFSSVSSVSNKQKWRDLYMFKTNEELDEFIKDVLPGSVAIRTISKKCSFCPVDKTHVIQVQYRLCKNQICNGTEKTNTCPVKYKIEKCLISQRHLLFQLNEHNSAENSQIIENYINGVKTSDPQQPSVILSSQSSNDSNHSTEKEPAKNEVKPKAKRVPKPKLETTKKTKKTEVKVEKRTSIANMFIKKTDQESSDTAIVIINEKDDTKVAEAKKTPKKSSSTAKIKTPRKEETPQKTVPKKSAFDFLMSKKKPPQLAEVQRQASETECILIDSSTCDSPRSKEESPFFVSGAKKNKMNSTTYQFKHVVDNFPSEPLFLTHQLQYDDKDRKTLRELSQAAEMPLKKKSSNDFDVNKINLNEKLNFTIKASENFINTNSCLCHKNIDSIDQSKESESFEEEYYQKSTDSPMSLVDDRLTKKRRTEKGVEGSKDENVEENELWTEKYQFKSENDIVTNNSQLERLKEWLNNWKKILSKEGPEKPSKKGKKSKKNIMDSESEYYDSDYSNYSGADSSYNTKKKFYSNALLLSGPHGCGKTSSVYSIAKNLGFKVFEVNASGSRCKSQIISELEGALNSHHVANQGNGVVGSVLQKKTDNVLTNILKKNELTPKETAKFKIDKFFKSGNFENQSIEHVEPVMELKSPIKPIEKKRNKKRKNSLRRETIHNLTNKLNFEFAKRELDIEDNSNEKSPQSTEIIDSEDSDADADDYFSKANNKNHKVTKKQLTPILKENKESKSVNIQRESLILFDEIDIIFKEDVGFWSAILHFVKRSRKPIVLTTSDEYLQDKMNLNVEKVDFMRPRVDASVRYLKRIAKSEHAELDTPTAYQIIQTANCDMRKALIHLQMLVSTTTAGRINLKDKTGLQSNNSTVSLSQYLPELLNCSHCKKQEISSAEQNLNPILFIDQLTKRITKNHQINNMHTEQFRKYDLVIYKDGLSDATEGPGFNPFMTVQSTEPLCLVDNVNTTDMIDAELYELYITLFNGNKLIQFKDWLKHGAINTFSFPSNAVLNRFAEYNCINTSNSSLVLDYRPFIQQICRLEEIKQAKSTKRRYLHYLTHYSIGIGKEDYFLLAKSSLIPKETIIPREVVVPVISYKEDDIYSDGGQ